MGVVAGLIFFALMISFPKVGFLFLSIKLGYDLYYQVEINKDEEIIEMLTSFVIASAIITFVLFTGHLKIYNNWTVDKNINDYTIDEVK